MTPVPNLDTIRLEATANNGRFLMATKQCRDRGSTFGVTRGTIIVNAKKLENAGAGVGDTNDLGAVAVTS